MTSVVQGASKFAGGLVGDVFGSFTEAAGLNTQYPGPSPEERALLAEQTKILRSQQDQLSEALRQQNLLQPLLFQDLGIEPVTDASGRVTGYRRAPKTPEQLQQAEIEGKLRERTLAALEGNLPVDPAFEREREGAQGTLEEVLRRNLGPGFETSSPGIEALGEFGAQTDALRYGIRTGMLTTSEALAGAREGRGLQEQAQTFGGLMQTAGSSLPFVQTGVGVAGGFSGPLSRLAGDRMLQAQIESQNSQQLMELITGAAKAGGYAFGGGFSKVFPSSGGGGGAF